MYLLYMILQQSTIMLLTLIIIGSRNEYRLILAIVEEADYLINHS
jgi:hypothetical protein